MKGLVTVVRGVALAVLVGALAVPAARGKEDDAKRGDLPVHALLIGCARYPALQARYRKRERGVPNPRLRGPERDVEWMRKTLVDLGVDEQRIRVLSSSADVPADRQPTRKNIVRELEALPARVRSTPDAQVLVLYAGHGTQQWETGEGDEIDAQDEAWCPMDTDLRVDEEGVRSWANVLVDDEIGALLRKVADTGALVWVVMDCCHAGSGVRGLEGASRGLPALPPPPTLSATAIRSAFGATEELPFEGEADRLRGIVAFYGSQSFERLHEVRVPDETGRRVWRGPLTVAVVRGLTSAGDRLPDLTFAELRDAVRIAYRDLGRLSSAVPQAEGELTRRVFRSGSVRAPRLVLRRMTDGRLALNAGALRGVRKDSEVTVYEAGGRGHDDKRLGRVIVRRVLASDSICEPVPGLDDAWGAAGEGAPTLWDAELTGPVLGPGTVHLALSTEHGAPRTAADLPVAFRRRFESSDSAYAAFRSRFRLVPRVEEADWLVLLDQGSTPTHLRRRGGRSDPQAIRSGADGEPPWPEDLERDLWSIYRAETLLDLHDQRVLPRLPENPPVFTLRAREVRPGGDLRDVEIGSTLAPGTWLRLGLEVHAAPTQQEGLEDAYDVYVFWLDPHCGFHKLYPPGALSPTVTRERTREIPLHFGGSRDTLLVDGSLGMERLLVFVRPQAASDGAALDLAFLDDAPDRARAVTPKGIGSHAVQQLHHLAFGLKARGEERWEEDPDAPETLMLGVTYWVTAWGALRAPAVRPDAPALRLERVGSSPLPRPQGSPPDAWSFGPDVRLARAGSGEHEAWCALVAEGDGAVHVLVDLDGGETKPAAPSADDLERLVREKAFDAELAYRFEPDGRRMVWYDADDDGAMDRVLVDVDGDRRAEQAWRKHGEAWTFDGQADLALLRTSHLETLSTQVESVWRILNRVRTLTTPP